MSERFARYCCEPGCTERHRNRGGYCDRHSEDNTYLRRRQARNAEDKKTDPVWRLYACVAWTKYFRQAFFGHGNVICQRIVDGVRCTRKVEILHHIVSPKKQRGLMYTPSNVVGVCKQHHPPTEGEPEENLPRLGEIYVPTVWKDIKF